MADSDKNIVITPQTSQTADPTIQFKSGATSGDPITLTVTDDGTTSSLSFGGSAGQLFSISNDLTGTIFGVADGSGIPIIEADADGTIRLAEFGGSVLIGRGTNTFIGNNAGLNNTTGSNNIFIGSSAGCSNINGNNNNFIGSSAGLSNTFGKCNNFIGLAAGICNTGGYYNNYIGVCAGWGAEDAFANNIIGNRAGVSITSGSYNNIMGSYAGYSNTTGRANNFMGWQSGYCNTTGAYNNFIGYQAGYSNTTGQSNNFIGYNAGRFNTSGSSNNFIGNRAGAANTSGSYNNFMGQYTGRCNTTGSYNTFYGFQAGRNNTTGSNNLFLGCKSGYLATQGLANITTESNRIIVGNCGHTCAQIQIGWTVVSDIRDKCIYNPVQHGRCFLKEVTPIEYSFKNRETNEITDPEGKRRYGFSAQEIIEIEKKYGNPVIANEDDPDKLNLTTDYIIPVLVNAVNELSAEVDQLKSKLTN